MTGLEPKDYRALALFRYHLRQFARFSKEFLFSKTGLTTEQYEALLAIKVFSGEDGLLVGQLSERLQVKHHTAVALTARLAERRLITKERGQKDRREVYIQLTGAGLTLIDAVAAVHRDALRLQSAELIHALQELSAVS